MLVWKKNSVLPWAFRIKNRSLYKLCQSKDDRQPERAYLCIITVHHRSEVALKLNFDIWLMISVGFLSMYKTQLCEHVCMYLCRHKDSEKYFSILASKEAYNIKSMFLDHISPQDQKNIYLYSEGYF